MKQDTKVRVYCALLGAAMGYFLTPKLVDGTAKVASIAKKIADKLSKRVL